jgi:hypothetical protein
MLIDLAAPLHGNMPSALPVVFAENLQYASRFHRIVGQDAHTGSAFIYDHTFKMFLFRISGIRPEDISEKLFSCLISLLFSRAHPLTGVCRNYIPIPKIISIAHATKIRRQLCTGMHSNGFSGPEEIRDASERSENERECVPVQTSVFLMADQEGAPEQA